jgi:hypothetical protein
MARPIKATKKEIRAVIESIVLSRNSGMPDDGIIAMLTNWVVDLLNNRAEVVDGEEPKESEVSPSERHRR